MNEYERNIFGGKCPYTTKPCERDISCGVCEVEEEERQDMERLNKEEQQEGVSE